MTDEQFDTLLKAVNEISHCLVVGIVGLAILISVLGCTLVAILQ